MRRETRSPRGTRSAGFTMLEAVVGVSIAVVVVGAAASALVTMQSGLTAQSLAASAEEVSRRTVDRLVEELRRADRDSVVLNFPTNATSVDFVTIDGWDAGGPILSATKTLAFASGQITLDGTVLAADGIGDVTFNFEYEAGTCSICGRTTQWCRVLSSWAESVSLCRMY